LELTSDARRTLDLNIVWQRYQSFGTQPPNMIRESDFQRFASYAQNADDSGVTRPDRNRDELLGMINYELGTAQHGTEPASAAKSFDEALRRLDTNAVSDKPDSHLKRQALLHTIRLLHARTNDDERKHKGQQQATVQEMGKIITEGCQTMNRMQAKDRGRVYGVLAEVAFLGTFLVQGESDTTCIGTITTCRQDDPCGRNTARTNGQTRSATDVNLFNYRGDSPLPVATTPIQIKSKVGDGPSAYKDHILILCATRELFISGIDELAAYGQSLASYMGEPDRTLEVACSNIELAQEEFRDTR
jgi:hypothetical protein